MKVLSVGRGQVISHVGFAARQPKYRIDTNYLARLRRLESPADSIARRRIKTPSQVNLADYWFMIIRPNGKLTVVHHAESDVRNNNQQGKMVLYHLDDDGRVQMAAVDMSKGKALKVNKPHAFQNLRELLTTQIR